MRSRIIFSTVAPGQGLYVDPLPLHVGEEIRITDCLVKGLTKGGNALLRHAGSGRSTVAAFDMNLTSGRYSGFTF